MTDTDNPDRNKWLHDTVNPDFIQLHSIRQVLYTGRTQFQSVDIVETGSFGICLVLDGKIQSSVQDEFIYHEALVHPAMVSHPSPETVFIAGGGEGATLREVLRHKTVKKVVMLDIDKEVVDICKQYLEVLHQNAFDDPRTTVYFKDARKYLQNTNEQFDVIIIDLVEPLEAGPANLLYTQEFYQLLKSRLSPQGILSVQSGASGWTNLQGFTEIVATLKSVFNLVSPYQTYVPSFADMWGFTAASETLDPVVLATKEIDAIIAERVSGELKSYDGISHHALFTIPRHLRHKLDEEHKIITDANPISI
jgi:spermidine synthase